jgi:indole-3-glycerol phosphate synthase
MQMKNAINVTKPVSSSKEHSFLARIIEHKHQEIVAAKQSLPQRELEQMARTRAAPRDFRRALTTSENIAVIAEMKKASPSTGVLRDNFDPAMLARSYAADGAAALSILTDEKFFHGHVEHLRQSHAVCALPLLRKDFLIEPYQIWRPGEWR